MNNNSYENEEIKALELADLFKVFSDSTRIKILYSLFQKPRMVNDIAAVVGMSQSAVSHQLKYLKSANLVKSNVVGKARYYELADDHVKTIISMGKEHIEE
ncbi:MAG: metalloregulator ArsR/SmtB family transcription factor [Erysipelotrichaceae bacterium]|nr:metalloregulator ArsR/SmtB family transcription factor [Erysipelotrichaceae bacterium]